ncbi:MAG: methyltransferase domain-containing protein [Desulfobacteraceae bacterium]|jgi:hypothetical protein
MNLPNIDWNECWRSIYAEKTTATDDCRFWDKRALEFTRHAIKGDYINQFLAVMQPQSNWSVLDIGSAAGTLAVPMASSVKHITAMDPSGTMLHLLKERCYEQGINNIDIVRGRWEDNWDELGIGIHDVAIASRSLIVSDLHQVVAKLQQYASKRVYISTLVDDGPYDRNIIEAVGRKFHSRADYILVYNFLRQMGIYANVSFTINQIQKEYNDLEDAINSLRWMIDGITAKEEERLRNYLAKTLVSENGHWKLPYRRVVRWAILWWKKEINTHHESRDEI